MQQFATRGATSFNIDLSDWNVMNGRDFSGMFRDATSFSQALCWQFRETVIVTAMFCESGGSFRKDCICEFDYYYDKTCTHPNLVPLVECSPPEPENAAFVAFSGISLALAGLVSSWFILL